MMRVMAPRPIRIYLSASIANDVLNLRLRQALGERFHLVLPQEFTPTDRSHRQFPRAIYQACIDEMEACDAGVLLLDAFGIDCASEAGWFAARDKPLIGIAQSNTRFLQHWMIKGNLTGVVSLDPLIAERVATDPILEHLPARSCDGWEGLPAAMLSLLDQLRAPATPAPRPLPHLDGGPP